jgi:hypothetical protein
MKPFDANIPCYCCSTKDAFSGATVVQVVSSRLHVSSVSFTSTSSSKGHLLSASLLDLHKAHAFENTAVAGAYLSTAVRAPGVLHHPYLPGPDDSGRRCDLEAVSSRSWVWT